jgi:hypothetical protein
VNVGYVTGTVLNRVLPLVIAGTNPASIQFIYLVNEKRLASDAEIRVLCSTRAFTPSG